MSLSTYPLNVYREPAVTGMMKLTPWKAFGTSCPESFRLFSPLYAAALVIPSTVLLLLKGTHTAGKSLSSESYCSKPPFSMRF